MSERDDTERTQADQGSGEPPIPTDGPFRFALALAAGGTIVILLGSVTIVPWIEDERRSETIRGVWLALSRNLPEIGRPALERAGFWLIVGLVALFSVVLLVLASAVRDDDRPDAESLA